MRRAWRHGEHGAPVGAEEDDVQLDGQVALVTGAGSGIGRASAVLFAQEGAKVAAIDRQGDEELRSLIAEIEGHGGEALPLAADVSIPDQIRGAIEQAADRWGRLDVAFANAGVNGVWAPLEELEPDEWDRTLAINLKGTFLTVKYAVPHLKRQGGSVIITSSVNGTRNFSSSGATAYSSSKAAQVAFTKMVALELAPHRVRANVICPGAIATNIQDNTEQRSLEHVRIPVEFPQGDRPLEDGQPGTAEQVARVVLFLASGASDHVTGAQIFVDGAESLLKG
jgi:NAD(P)-dependent dehydrogenase (short-subunit alcohol dehydrogenase family)